MTFGVRRPSRIDAVFVSIVPLAFSIGLAMGGPTYEGWFGTDLLGFTRRFIDSYPLWIVLTGAGIIVHAGVKLRRRRGTDLGLWTTVDAALGFISVLIVLVGFVALILPIILYQFS